MIKIKTTKQNIKFENIDKYKNRLTINNYSEMENRIISKVYMEHIHNVVKELGVKEYNVFCLRYIDGYSQYDTANALGKLRSQISFIERKIMRHLRNTFNQTR